MIDDSKKNENKKSRKKTEKESESSDYDKDSFCTSSTSSDTSGEEEGPTLSMEEENFHHRHEPEYHQNNPALWELDCGQEGVVHILKRKLGV